MQCEGDLPLLAETLGVVVVGVDEEAAQVSVCHAAVLTDRSLEVAEIGKPVDGPALGIDLDGVAKERRGLALVSSFGVILQPVHVDQIEREQLLEALLEVEEDRVVRLLHLGVALHLLRLVEQGHVVLDVIIGDTECGLGS